METNKIYLGNALEILKIIPSDSIDCIITSPPYFSMRNYDGYKEQFGYFNTKEEYTEQILGILKEVPRILKDSGSFLLNLDDVFDREWQNVLFKIIEGINKYLILQEKFIWIKKNPQPYLSESRVTHGYEYCFLFIKNNLKFKFNKKKEEMITDTFFCKIGNGKTEHIAVFPKELPEFFIKLLTKEGEIVMDIFCGSGTTLLSAKELNRRYIGIELKPEYYNMAKQKLSQTKLNIEKTLK